MAPRLAQIALRLRATQPLPRHNIADLGPFFQGALMELLAPEYAEHLHALAVNPYSQHVIADATSEQAAPLVRWVIKTLDDEAAAHITAPFTGGAVQRVALSNPGIVFGVEDVSAGPSLTTADLNSIFYSGSASSRVRVVFQTPTSFRTQGSYTFWPEPRLVFQSLALKHAAAFDGDQPDQELVDELGRSILLTSYRLASRPFKVGATRIPGFTGSAVFSVRGAPTFRNYVEMLLRFGEFSGCGIKSSMGMGAIAVEAILRKDQAA